PNLVRMATTSGEALSLPLQVLINGLRQAEVEALLKELEAGAFPQEHPGAERLKAALYAQWVRLDPKKARAMAEALDDRQKKTSAIQAVLGELALHDPAKAIDWFNQLDSPHLTRMAAYSMVKSLSGAHPELAFQLVRDNNDQFSSTWPYAHLFHHWGFTDPEAALASLEKMPDGEDRMEASRALTKGLASANPQEAIALAEKMSDQPEANEIINRVVMNVAAREPHKALEIIEETEGNIRRDLIGSIAMTWSSHDPKAAFQWLQELPGDEKIRAFASSVGSLASASPEKAADFLTELPLSETSLGAYAELTHHWGRHDSDAAEAWARELPGGPTRSEAIRGLLIRLETKDPARAARLRTEEKEIDRPTPASGFFSPGSRQSRNTGATEQK
ncbi:MAG: hypothetical protein AAF514_21165, partial [Verrucomicrobiota bacterium]